jgi:hypothetical protein
MSFLPSVSLHPQFNAASTISFVPPSIPSVSLQLPWSSHSPCINSTFNVARPSVSLQLPWSSHPPSVSIPFQLNFMLIPPSVSLQPSVLLQLSAVFSYIIGLNPVSTPLSMSLLPSVSLPLPWSSHTPSVSIPFQLHFQRRSHHLITNSSRSGNKRPSTPYKAARAMTESFDNCDEYTDGD